MVLRIRFERGVHIQRTDGKNRHLALAFAGLLTPASLMAGTLAVWRLAADMQWASEFAITTGPFSHWLVWMGMAGGLLFLAARLNRYGRGGPRLS
jgi:hypothetical protein